jgi:uncharacterized protein
MKFCLLASLAIAAASCQAAATPKAVTSAAVTTEGFFVNGDVRLSYRLEIPARSGKVGAVVFGHGSGRLNKDSCRFLAGGFLARGFATLCYDKRGVGQSTGEYSGVGAENSIRMFDLLGGDMAAGVRFLRSRDEIDAARIGLVGNSQAGWIIPVAATKARPAFMIMLVGPTVSTGEEIFYSRLVEHNTQSLEEGYRQLPSFTGERGFDPRPVLAALDVPGLWLLGGRDRSIPTPATVAILDQLIAAGRPFARVVFAEHGHDLSGASIWAEIDRWLTTTLHH